MSKYLHEGNVMYGLILYDMAQFANEESLKELERLRNKMKYTAPEQKANVFWHGTFNQKSICEICQEFFPNDNCIFNIFKKAHDAEDSKAGIN